MKIILIFEYIFYHFDFWKKRNTIKNNIDFWFFLPRKTLWVF